MIERKWLADGVMEIRLIGDDGELDGIMELTRPTEHAVYAAHLLAAQREIAARRGAPQSGRVLRFPAARGQSA
jgi:hypothetical protein